MSTPPAVVVAAPGKVMPAGPPEHPASGPGPSVNGAGLAVMRPQNTVPAVSCALMPVGSSVVALNNVGKKGPICRVPSISPQPRLVSTPIGTLVAKVAPGHQLPKPSHNGGVRLATPHLVASKAAQTTTIQLPANFQFPQGTILVRSNTGQLMLVAQQALVQAQSQILSNATTRQSMPTKASAVKIRTVQNSGTTQVLKMLAAPVKTVSRTTPSVPSSVKRPAVIQTTVSTSSHIGTVASVKSLNAVPSINSTASNPSTQSVTQKPGPEKTVLDKEGTAAVLACTSTEMLENVKKCKNFLATLIKLASSGPQAPEMGQNVNNLIQSLLEAKIEPEEFTKKLYIELKSSPKPYLVPFLKKSMHALRQLMPNAQSFIQQCVQQPSPPVAASPCLTTPTTSSAVRASIPVTASSLQPTRPVSSIPGGTTSLPLSNPAPCTQLVTHGSGSLRLVQPTQAVSTGALSFQGVNLVSSTQLTTGGANTVKAVPATSATDILTRGTTSFLAVKPVLSTKVPPAADAAVNPVKTVFSSAVTRTEKQVITAVATTSTPTVTMSLPSATPVTGPPITIRLAHPNSLLSQSVQTSNAVKVKHLVLQQPSGNVLKKVTTLPQNSALCNVNKLSEKMPLKAAIQANQCPAGSMVKQITLPGNKILTLQASPVQRNNIKENRTPSFRDEDDINDVASMAGVNLSEERACILSTNSEAVGMLIRSCPVELLLSSNVLEKMILEIGKRHDITEVNSDVLNLISLATQERLQGLLEKLTLIAQHRVMTYKASNNYVMSSDTRAQLKFLEKLEHMEKQRKNEEQREALFRAAKSRSNKEDPEQLRLKQKAKEMQQLELAQMQQREANLAALAAIGPRRKRPLDSSSIPSGLEGLNGSPSLAKSYLRPRIIHICLRDLIFCMEQEKDMKHSLALYQALLK